MGANWFSENNFPKRLSGQRDTIHQEVIALLTRSAFMREIAQRDTICTSSASTPHSQGFFSQFVRRD
jgi:hypothetical protein